MATYYSSPSNQREPAPILYPREHIPTSYPEASVLSSNMMIYMSSEPYTEAAALAASSQQQSNCLEIPPIGLASDSASQQHDILSSLGGFSESPSIVHGVQGQGLSLSLGTTFRGPNNMGFASFHDHHHPRGVEYLGFGDQDSSKPDFPPYGIPGGVSRVVPGSKYLKAAQQLLDEVVNVKKALRQSDAGEKGGQEKRTARSPNKDGDDGSKSESTLGGGGDSSAGNSQPPELSHTEKQDLQNKLTKLLSMLDEVDRRYKQYYHQMQIVVSSFDAIAGGGSAKPYTVLALQTISRHFRCLRDAITGQIKATRKSLGEDDTSGNAKGVGISRLRYVDQQLRQQRALQQLGMMQQHTWRPQRGLPESSVSILRAWLFEHFLHPYPKDSDKIMLARQTGLTRSQVSNWFINARVRLWKPMVEEMYKEETGDADMDSNSSSENAARASKAGGGGGDDDRPEDSSQHHRQSASSTGPFVDPAKPNHVPQPDVEMAGGPDYGGLMMMKPPPPPQRREDLYPGPAGFHHETGGGGERFAVAAAASYHMSEMGRYGGGAAGGSGVSLTLGLQHCDGGPGGPHHHGFVGMRGHGDMYSGGAPTVGPEGLDFEQPRFAAAAASSSHLLHDFVV